MSYNVDNVRSGNTVAPWAPPSASSWEGESVFSPIMAASMVSMLFHAQTSQGLVNKMQERMKVARESTEMAHLVDAAIAKMDDPKAGGTLPESVISYMKENNIRVGGKTIDEFIASAEGGVLDAGDMKAIHGSLDTTSRAASDSNQLDQLRLQDLLTKFNSDTQRISSTISMQGKLNSELAQNIR
ncbi:hypothetical protein [Pseudomonas sp. TH31]|uniref:hypothetical protein n=1 Tax=Pseudomonas sp. TH31 TaxID=2796396 RepID=UPI001913DB9B|nr:hypothetical protein [Pseudomonas sp. TH31]MBK5415405.1 hypothetical protein [Pseudomonas sp. TH31]